MKIFNIFFEFNGLRVTCNKIEANMMIIQIKINTLIYIHIRWL